MFFEHVQFIYLEDVSPSPPPFIHTISEVAFNNYKKQNNEIQKV